MPVYGPFAAEQAAALSRQLASEGFAVAVAEDARGSWLRLTDEGAERRLRALLDEAQDRVWQDAPATRGGPGLGLGWRLPPSGWVTRVVFALCVLVYLAMQIWPRPVFNTLHFFVEAREFWGSEPWRWLSPAFMHFSLLHILFNLLWWWQLGGLVEKREGSGRLLLILIAGSALPHLLQWWWTGPGFGGLSGVVYALLGYVWLSGRLRPQLGIQVPNSVMVMMVLWLGWGFVAFMGPVMANGAHLGGLLVGLVLAGIFSLNRR